MCADVNPKAPCPRGSSGSAWYAFEFLSELLYVDTSARARMSGSQRDLLAFFRLRQAINSGGLDSYLRYHGEEAGRVVSAALNIAGPDLHEFCQMAVDVLGVPYPANRTELESRVDLVGERLDELDNRYYKLEAAQSLDEVADRWVWDRRPEFFEVAATDPVGTG